MTNLNFPASKAVFVVTANRTMLFRPRLPYHIVWLATNACNARCVHCSSDAAKRLPGELTTAEAKNLFQELANLGVFDVAVSGGEPLTRRDIFDVMEYATRLGIRLGLGSNGSTVNEKVTQKLLEIGLNRLQISIDGLEATHDVARRWPGLFQKATRAIKLALKEGLRVHVCFTAHRLNFREIDRVIDLCVNLGVHRFNFSRLVPTGRADNMLDLTPGEWKETISIFDHKRDEYKDQMEFSTHLAQQILSDSKLENQPGFIGCQAGVGQGCIDSVGNVMPCVMLPIIVGNIRQNSFEEIWNSSETIHSLQDRSRLKGICQSCSHREKCGGCRGVAYGYTGDHLAADPRCWIYSPLKQKRQESCPVENLQSVQITKSIGGKLCQIQRKTMVKI